MNALLHFLSSSRKTGVLTVLDRHRSGRIFLREGRICHASIENASAAFPPRKALYRMMGWKSAISDFIDIGIPEGKNEFVESTDSLLCAGAQQSDRLEAVQHEFLPPETQLEVSTPLPGRIKDLPAPELEVLQAVLEQGTMQAVLDANPLTDFTSCCLLLNLMDRGFVRKAAPPAADARKDAPDADENFYFNSRNNGARMQALAV